MSTNYNILQQVKNFKFTNRECDVISCILNNRGEKKISEILDISPNTVSTHVSNILGKIGASSKERIIDLVYKSELYGKYQIHYNHLYQESVFRNALISIGKILKNKKIFAIVKSDTEKENSSKLLAIIKHLKLANIDILTKQTLSNEDQYIIFTSFDEFKKSSQNQKKLFLDFQDNFEIDSDFKRYRIMLGDKGSLYNGILEIIVKITENLTEIEKISAKFKEDYSILNSNSINKVQAAIPTKIFDFISKKKYQMMFLSVLGLFSMLLFFKLWNENFLPRFHKTISWQLPVLVEHNIDRKTMMDQIRKKLDNCHKAKFSICFVGLTGLSGVGKSTLAKNVVNSSIRDYSFIGWFQADNKKFLENEYLEIGGYNNLFHQNMNSSQKILAVKEWIEKHDKKLLVYDNIQDISIIKEFIPKKADVILTSKNKNIPNATEVNMMSQEESKKLLGKLLAGSGAEKSENYKNELSKLAFTLGYLPLAMDQAGAYIKQNKITIAKYLVLFADHHKVLMKNSTMPHLDCHSSAYSSWDLIMSEIINHQNGKEALEILNFVSYFNSEKIPKKLLLVFLNSQKSYNSIELNKIIHLLESYSLINSFSETISIHKLTASWIRSKHNPETAKTWILKCFEIIKSLDAYNRKDAYGGNIKFLASLLPHIQTLISHLKRQGSKFEVATLKNIIGYIYYDLNYYQKSIQELEEALKIKKSILPLNDSILIDTMSLLSMNYYLYGKMQHARKLVTETTEIAEKINHHNEDSVHAYLISGMIYCYLGEYEASKKLLEKSLKISQTLNNKNYPLIAINHRELGRLYEAIGNYHKSLECFQNALIIQEKYLGESHIALYYTLGLLGHSYALLGNYEKAAKMLRRSEEILKEDAKYLTQSFAIRSGIISRAYYKSGKYNIAKETLLKALENLQKYPNNKNMYLTCVLSDLGIIENILGNHNQSEKNLIEALKWREEFFEDGSIRVAKTQRNLGITYISSSRYDRGINLLKESHKIFVEKFGDQNIQVADIVYHLGIGYMHKKDYDKARDCFEEALKINEKYFGDNKIKLLPILQNLSSIYLKTNNIDSYKATKQRIESFGR